MKKTLCSILLLCISMGALAQLSAQLPGISGQTILTSSQNGLPAMATEDRFGSSVANIGDVNNDGIVDMVVGSPQDDNGGTSTQNFGAVYICFMSAQKTVSSYVKIGKATAGISADISASDFFGRSVTGLGDLDGDGVEDIAVGAYGEDVTNFNNCGGVYVLLLNSNGSLKSYVRITKGVNGGPNNLQTASQFGMSVSNLGDINGDNVTDIAVGGNIHDGTGVTDCGAVWTLLMNSNATVASSTIITHNTGGLGSLVASDNFGVSVSGAGDLNGDGVEDVLVGANLDDSYGANYGCFYLLYLNSNGAASSVKKYVQPFYNGIVQYTTTSSFGIDVFAHDVDEDGQPEFLVGSYSESSIYILSTDSLENITSVKKYTSNVHWNQNVSGYGLGVGITSLNDIDGDGKKELAFGASIYDAAGLSNNGAVVVVDMESQLTEVNLGDVYDMGKYGDLSNDMPTLDAADLFGTSVCDIGDVNGDGYGDIAIGAIGDDDGGTNRGAVYIVFLNGQQVKTSVQKIASGVGGLGALVNSDNFGNALAAPGDLDGDNIPDLIVGSYLDDAGATDRGAVYILYLNSNGTVKSQVKIGSGLNGFTGTLSNGCRFGSGVAVIGDVDNDGVNDIAVGADKDDDGGTDRGAVWVLLMNANETVKGHQKISDTQGSFTATFSGNSVNFGTSVSGLGDVNGDQVEDIAVGSPAMDGKGAVYVLYLTTTGSVSGYKKIGDGNFPLSLQSGKLFGVSVAQVSDMNGDGRKELAIGQRDYRTYGQNHGGVWLAYPDSVYTVTGYSLVSDSTARFNETAGTSDYLGTSVSTYKGPNNSEYLLMGASQHKEDATATEGAVFKAGIVSISFPAYAKFQPTYLEVEKKLDGEYYKIADKTLRFRYYDKYNDDDNKLSFKIYNAVGNVVYSDASLTLDPNYGENRFTINCGPTGANLPWGNYVLEVTNTKKEKYYLRFDLVNPSTIK